MATKTNKLGLTLPAGSETVNINVLNDNFSIIDEKVGSTIVYEGDFGTNEELLEKINAAYSMVDDNSVGHAKLRATVEGLEIGGGTWHFTFYRTNATYGWLECGTYYGNYKYYRRLYEGKWEEWVDISPRPPVPAIHASQHAADGNDPLTPEMIGITTIVATDENDDGNVVLEAYVGDSYAEHTGAQNNPHNVTAEQISAAPVSHMTDTNNPHNVTIEQIGAAPSGYGLGGQLPLTTADAAVQTGFYRVWLENVLGYTGYVNLMVMNNNDQVISQTAFGVNNRVLFRVYYNTWGNWVDLSPSAFAPSGYGLGVACQYIDSWKQAIKPGYYVAYTDSPDGSFWHGQVMANSAFNQNTGTQIVQRIYNNKSWNNQMVCCERISRDLGATWQPWEWVNPPMMAGVVYRTTERYNGAAVYAKLVYVANLPNNASKTVDGVIDNGITRLVDLQYTVNTSWTKKSHDSRVDMTLGVESPYAWLTITTTADMSACSGYVLIKWTKD